MRKFLAGSILSVCLLAAATVHAAPPSKAAPGTMVIVFKDGHRQSFNLSEIDRVESAGAILTAAELESPKTSAPPRGRFVGKWEVGDGAGSTFTITLNENGSAYRTLGSVRGHWQYVKGDALITWDDGPQDAIRKVGARYQKFAYVAGKSFSDSPDNVTDAHNTSPRPI